LPPLRRTKEERGFDEGHGVTLAARTIIQKPLSSFLNFNQTALYERPQETLQIVKMQNSNDPTARFPMKLVWLLWMCDSVFMRFLMTISGTLVPMFARTLHDEIMVNCARIGFKP
jgi:hypothetical protein